jgi:Cu/Ag efflux pump CusA
MQVRQHLHPFQQAWEKFINMMYMQKKGMKINTTSTELRTIQDWIIIPQLQGVKGVAEVSTWGGSSKQLKLQLTQIN